MKRLLFVTLVVLLSAAPVAADDQGVPTTVEGGAATIKEGGRDIGEGFKGIGRGIRDVFTGRASKEDFKEGKKIGTGTVDVGRGVGGLGRGAGREVKKGFKGGDSAEVAPVQEGHSSTLTEEELTD